MADININKVLKKWSLLEEIQGTNRDSYSRGVGHSREGKPIIVVPSADYPGNICLKNSVEFLRDGEYKVASEITAEDKFAQKRSFEK